MRNFSLLWAVNLTGEEGLSIAHPGLLEYHSKEELSVMIVVFTSILISIYEDVMLTGIAGE
jgi:hypothetical protein